MILTPGGRGRFVAAASTLLSHLTKGRHVHGFTGSGVEWCNQDVHAIAETLANRANHILIMAGAGLSDV